MSAPPPSLPSDPSLPITDRLFDRERVKELFPPRWSDQGLGAVELRYLECSPGQWAIAQYRVETDAGPRSCALDINVTPPDRRSEAGVVHRPEFDVTAAWDPIDPLLPGLRDPAEVFANLGLEAGEMQRLAWVPRRRAAIGVGRYVAKCYADDDGVDAAIRGIEVAGGCVSTAELVAVDREQRVVVQSRVGGSALDPADLLDVIEPVAGVLDALQSIDRNDLGQIGGVEMMELARGPVALASFARPDLAEQMKGVVSALHATCPSAAVSVGAHGDFNAGQLLLGADGAVSVIDLDTACRSLPGFDAVSCAANLISGRPNDLNRADAVLNALLPVVNRDPIVDWMFAVAVLRRVDRPVRRLKGRWPQRVAQLVSDVSVLADRVR